MHKRNGKILLNQSNFSYTQYYVRHILQNFHDLEKKVVTWTIIGCLGGALLLFILITLFTALHGYRKLFDRRYNGNPNVRYFTADDFAGIEAEAVEFASDCGVTLRGFIYRAAGAEARALVIFSHGFGAGHLAYTTEIATLARAGFWVLAYDGTGCAASGGDRFVGFIQGVIDHCAALRFAATDERLKNLQRISIGHSWGAFSVLNALGSVPVLGAVAMCGFVTGSGVMAQSAFGRFAPMRALYTLYFRLFDRVRFGRRVRCNTIRSLRRTRLPVFVLYGACDGVVPFRWNGKRVLRSVRDLAHVRALLCRDKGHNVYLTCEAEQYMNQTFAQIAAQGKEQPQLAAELYAQADYRKMTEEDPAVMSEVIAFCESIL